MTDTPLIRRQVTADRGTAVLVTTHDVLQCIRGLSAKTFSTREVADALREAHPGTEYSRLEYAVRQSISWLVKRGYVEIADGTVKRYTQVTHAPYWCSVYVAVDRGEACDCALLNKIFFGV